MIIQCFAVGTPWAYIYVGDEYPLAIHRQKMAVQQAYAAGLLGENIMGSGFTCHVDVQMGGGAYISGEASALMFGMEGKRAMPRTKPPRSVEAGLFNLPTVVNNTETMSCVPQIIINGAEWFTAMGTENSKGTKLFTLMGSIERIGIYEMPWAAQCATWSTPAAAAARRPPLQGDPDRRPFRRLPARRAPRPDHGLQVAGPVRRHDGLRRLRRLRRQYCIVDMSRYFGRFNRYQSCGKCVPCRVGTKNLLHMVDSIALGNGRPEDIDVMKKWSDHVVEMSLCGLGQTAPLPLWVASATSCDEFVEHINDKHCRPASCDVLVEREQGHRSTPPPGSKKPTCPPE